MSAAPPAGAVEPKARVRAALAELGELCDAVGLPSLARDVRETRLPKLDDERVTLVVLGEFNHGKSTFLNALLGEAVLPTGPTPTTGTVCCLEHGPAFAAEAVLTDGRRAAISRDALPGWLRGTGAPIEGAPVDRIEVRLPAPLLADRVTVVDTPGVNDLSEQRADITYGYLPRADAVVFLLDATQVLTASERRFLAERVLRERADRLVFVVAKADLLDDGERAEVESFARAELAELVPDPALHFVSARKALAALATGDDAALAATGLPALREVLDHVLRTDRARLVLDHALADGERLARLLRHTLAMRRAALRLPGAALDERIARARADLDSGQRALERASEALRAGCAAQRARVREGLGELTAALVASLPGEIERASAEDVRDFLAPFLEDTFRDWITHEAQRLGGALHALAEEVLAIAADDLARSTAGLARDLGTAVDAVEVDLPLGAEASVFALGALGGAALLFVHALAGGALALVTPALAAIVRARTDRAARAEAVARAPEWVRGLADEVAPRLHAVVDDFEARLHAFITEAGAALARGLVELLESARAERASGDAEAAAVAALVPLEERLRAAEEDLVSTRQQLWSEGR